MTEPRTKAGRRLLQDRDEGGATVRAELLDAILAIEAEAAAGPRDEGLGDAIHTAVHPGHPWSGCSNPDLVYVWVERFRAALKASE